MNIGIRITLSLSLIACIAQSAHAASYTDHAKTAGKVAWHLAQVGAAGVIIKDICRPIAASSAIEGTVGGIVHGALVSPILYNGIKGLKQDIDQVPEYIKQPVRKAGKIALHLTQTGFGAIFMIMPVLTHVSDIHAAYLNDSLVKSYLTDLSDIHAVYRNGSSVKNYLRRELLTHRTILDASFFAAGCFAVSNGIKGLKKEICPDFNLIAWAKNKLGKSGE